MRALAQISNKHSCSGAETLSIMKLNITALSIITNYYVECHLCLVSSMLHVANNNFMLSVIMLSVIMLSAIMLSVVVLSVVVPSVVAFVKIITTIIKVVCIMC
jgi:hypothetical protein